MAALGPLTHHRPGRCFSRCRSDAIKLCDRAQNFAAVPQQNPEVLEVLLRQIADDREVDGIVGEPLGVLSQADRCEPLGDAPHGICRRWRVLGEVTTNLLPISVSSPSTL